MRSREECYALMHSMNKIICHILDDDKKVFWLQEYSPDDAHSLDDQSLFAETERMARIFAETIRSATEDGYDMYLYFGQTTEEVSASWSTQTERTKRSQFGVSLKPSIF